ncbi:hypothetical protein C8R46DRAFT_1114557 [Mycena filopes]|nr:hypothetical protein C8R46DRAFT_1114557 [Mycena filopes]
MSQICKECGALSTVLVLPPPIDFASSSPNLTRLLTSNDAPLESDVAAARGIVSSGQTRVYELSAQIYAVQTTLSQLVRSRAETEDRVHQHQSILAPIRRVPPELLCEIFLLALGSDDAPKESPWYLGQVCRSWRRSALAFPGMWSFITVPSVSSGDSGLVSLLELQLLRSANAPLDVYWPNARMGVNPNLAGVVLAQCSRWRRLRFEEKRSAPSSHRLAWLEAVRGRLDTLERLETCFTTTAEEMVLPDVFLSAPNLRQVLLTDENGQSSPTVALPWTQITHYGGKSSPQEQRRILGLARNLLVCNLTFTGHLDASVVTLPHLRHLSLSDPRFLLGLTAPSLVELVSLYSPRLSMQALLSFVQRSGCTLTKLVLRRCGVSPELISALRGLPALTYLLVEAAGVGHHDAFFAALTLSSEPSDSSLFGNLCPNLTSFVHGLWIDHPDPWSSLFAMIRSRCESPRLLNLLQILQYDAKNLPDDVCDRIRRLREQGLDVQLLGRSATVRLLHSTSVL